MLEDYASHIIDGHVYVLEYQQSIQGLLVLVPEEHCLLLDNVAVAPQAQGRGLGRIMLEFSERVAIDCNYSSIRLYTHELMVENIQTYLRYGYVETHRADVNGLRRVYMSKVLGRTPMERQNEKTRQEAGFSGGQRFWKPSLEP